MDKKCIRIAMVLLTTVVFATPAHAQITRPVSGVVAASSAPIEIRYSEEDGPDIGRLARTGDPIYLDDEIVTGPEVSVQILLKDQTLFSIGPSSAIVIDRFVYDPGDQDSGSLVATIRRGTFKFISGRIAKADAGAMELNLPNAVASIRGTSGAGRVSGNGVTEIAVLSGAISLMSDEASTPVDLFTSGWGVTISPAGAIGAPELLPANVLDSIIASTEFIQPAASAGNAGEAENSSQANGSTGNEGGAVAAPLAQEQIEASLADAETLDEAITAISAELGSTDGAGSLSAAEVGRILLENQHLLQLTNIDPALLAPEESVGVNIESALLNYALQGGVPQWLMVTAENGDIRIGNPSPGPDYTDLVSSVYAGSVRYDATGLELPNAGDSAEDSGMADYDISFSYDTQTFTGTYRIYDLVMGGRSYADSGDISFTARLHDQAANADERIYKGALFDATGNLAPSGNVDENGNGLLDVNETLEGLTFARDTVSMTGSSDYEGHVSVGGHLGSISNGITAVDGTFGGISVAVDEVDASGANRVFTGNSVSGINYQIGEVN